MITLILYVALIGLLAYLIVTFIPMPPKFAQAIYILAGIAALLVILSAFGVGLPMPHPAPVN